VLSALPAVVDVSVFGTTLHAHLIDDTDPLSSIRNALGGGEIDIESVTEIPAGLEDTFLFLTRSATAPLSMEAT
jgi:hypothetical protein